MIKAKILYTMMSLEVGPKRESDTSFKTKQIVISQRTTYFFCILNGLLLFSCFMKLCIS